MTREPWLRFALASCFALCAIPLSASAAGTVSPASSPLATSTIAALADADRVAADTHALAYNATLEKAAQMKADDMAAKHYFAHVAPDGQSPWHWFRAAGYQFSYAGENLAVHFTSANDVNDAWMNSPAHRANLLNPHFTQIGVGIAHGTYSGVETTFVVELFGTPPR